MAMKPTPTPDSTAPLETALSGVARALARDRRMQVMLQAGGGPAGLGHNAALRLAKPVGPQEAQALDKLRADIDLAALGRRYHNPKLHLRERPAADHQAAIFDAMEQMRVSLLGGRDYAGVRRHLDQRLEQHCDAQGYARLSERADPPLADILAALLREEITGAPPPAALARLVRLWEPFVRKSAGDTLASLKDQLDDQQHYARAVRTLLKQLSTGEDAAGGGDAAAIDSVEASDSETLDEQNETESLGAISGEEQQEDQPGSGDEGDQESPSMGERGEETAGRKQRESRTGVATPQLDPRTFYAGDQPYRIYTEQFDEAVPAHRLASPEELARLRAQLDQKLAQVRGTFARLSAQLQRLLLARQQRSWDFDLEEGLINTARLARVVSNPAFRQMYKQEKEAPFKDTVITLLMDNSGSMRGRPITIAALSADILARSLERAGIKVEILGFTTRDWKGGHSYKDWVKSGRPPKPGRLNDLRHIIYKSADQPLVRARRNLGLMLKEGLLKENIDGEALLWAYNRLLKRNEARRILMVISDGAPVDDATLSANFPGYLDRHLRDVITHIEGEKRVELLAIGIGHDVGRYYARSVTLSDITRLGETMARELVKLFET
jgi:cobaltochelatase CobT